MMVGASLQFGKPRSGLGVFGWCLAQDATTQLGPSICKGKGSIIFHGEMKPQTPGCKERIVVAIQPSTNRKLDLTHENFLLVESRGYRRPINKAQVALQASRLSCEVL